MRSASDLEISFAFRKPRALGLLATSFALIGALLTGLPLATEASASPSSTTVAPRWNLTENTASNWSQVTYGGGTWIAVAPTTGSNQILRSTDGSTWSVIAPPSGARNFGVVSTDGDDTFVALSSSGAVSNEQVLRSTDGGLTWTMGGLGNANTMEFAGVAFGNGTFVAGGNDGSTLYTSPNGAPDTWIARAETRRTFSIAFGNNTFVRIHPVPQGGSTNEFSYSTDGTNWTYATLPELAGKVFYGGGKFITVGGGSRYILTSSDGVAWTRSSQLSNLDWRAAGYAAGAFIAIGYGAQESFNRVASSLDGITWVESGVDPDVAGPSLNFLATDGDQLVGTSSGIGLWRTKPPVITAGPTPDVDITLGGRSVTFTGGNLDEVTSVEFGGTAGVVTSQTASSLTVTAPRSAAGTVRVRAVGSGPAAGSVTLDNAFSFFDVPAPGVVLPHNGPTTGGTEVTIIGSGFTGVSSVTFGGVAGTNLTVDDTTITVTTPANSAGTVDVVVTNPATSRTVSSIFTYQAPVTGPVINSIAPVTGPVAGGGTLTLTGTGLGSATSASIGGNTATITSNTSTQIQLTIPPGVAGQDDVEVVVGGVTYTANNGYLYIGTPTITSVTPSVGPISGGQTAVITGTGFLGGTSSVTFEDVNQVVRPAIITATSVNTVTVVTPGPAQQGDATVALTSLGGFTSAANLYSYIGPPNFAEVSPSNGGSGGGTRVVLTSPFDGALANTTSVLIGGQQATIVSTSAPGVVPSEVVVITPPGSPGTADIDVTALGGTGTQIATFTYVNVTPGDPAITSIAPSSGSVLGGGTVTITGTDLGSVTTVQAVDPNDPTTTLNFTNVQASATQVTATIPAVPYAFYQGLQNSQGFADIKVDTGSASFTAARSFTFTVPDMVVQSITPSAGPPAGGQAVFIRGSGFTPFPETSVSVDFNNQALTPTSVSDTEITLSTPSGTLGQVNVFVNTSSPFNFQAVPNGYEYVNAPTPTITSVSPTSGSAGGGTSVTIAGTNLSSAGPVTIGGSNATITSNTASSVVVTTPPGSGTVDVVVTTPGGSVTRANAFTYVASAPGAPTSVTATGGNAQASVSWTAPASTGGAAITGYTVTASPGGQTCSATPPNTTCTVTGLANGTAYTFTATATNSAGTSVASAASNSVTPIAAPGIPGIPTAVVTSATSATVTPTPPSSGGPVASYAVTASPGGATCTVTAPATSCAVTGLAPSQAYTFTSTATNSSGTSSASAASASVTLSAPGTPGTPTAVGGPANATVSVTPGSGGTPSSYTVTSAPGGLTCSVTPPATSCVVAGLTPGTPYTFTATATNGIGTSGSSASSNAVTPTANVAPGTPGTPTAVAGNGQATVTIAAPGSGGSPTSYTVMSTPGGLTCTVTVPSTSCAVSGLTNGTAYTFTSTATNSAGTSGASAASTAVTPLAPPGTPGQPQAVVTSSTSATITPTPPTAGGPVASYTVTASPGGATCTVTPPATTCAVSGLAPGQTYTFVATASNVGGTSGPSSASSAVVLSAPGTPAAPVAVAGAASATVSVTPGSGGTPSTYTITSSPAAGSCTVTAPASSCTVTGLTAGTAYTFTATATNGIGTSTASAASNSVTPTSPTPPTPPTPTPPSSPTAVTATAGANSITVSWSAPTNSGSFPVSSYRVIATPGSASCLTAATTTTCTLTGLSTGTAYTLTVAALSGAGWGSPASVGPITPGSTPPGTPAAPVVLAGNGQVTVIATPPTTGGPVASYLATASPGGATCTIVVPATSCVIAGLTNGQNYTVTTVATNTGGSSSSSPSSTAVAPAPPITPVPINPQQPPAPGASQYYLNGQPASGLVVQPNESSNGLRVTDTEFRMILAGESQAGTDLPLGSSGQLVLLSGGAARTQGDGFRPDTQVALYISRTNLEGRKRTPRNAAPELMGAVAVTADGTFTGRVDLPIDLAPGDYLLEALGVTLTNQSRAVLLGITVQTPDATITLVKGNRTSAGKLDRVRATGATVGIPEGARLIPYFRFGASREFQRGRATIIVDQDGKFRWTRLIRPSRKITAYVAFVDASSNRVTWRKLR